MKIGVYARCGETVEPLDRCAEGGDGNAALFRQFLDRIGAQHIAAVDPLLGWIAGWIAGPAVTLAMAAFHDPPAGDRRHDPVARVHPDANLPIGGDRKSAWYGKSVSDP